VTTLLVFSKRPAGVSPEAFNRWYDIHVQEILELPSFVGAERFELRFVRSTSGEMPPFDYGLRFEIDGDFAPAWAELEAAVDSGEMDFPDWMPAFKGYVWECMALGGRAVNQP
jgi:hypothetical protein